MRGCVVGGIPAIFEIMSSSHGVVAGGERDAGGSLGVALAWNLCASGKVVIVQPPRGLDHELLDRFARRTAEGDYCADPPRLLLNRCRENDEMQVAVLPR